MDNTNGKANTRAVMTLSYDLLTGTLNINSDAPSLSISISMLAQALREFDALERMNRAQLFAQQQKEAAEVARLTQHVKGRI